jgi:hypothetical protein
MPPAGTGPPTGRAAAHPDEYALVYGTPVPGYIAPSATIAPAARVSEEPGDRDAFFADCVRRWADQVGITSEQTHAPCAEGRLLSSPRLGGSPARNRVSGRRGIGALSDAGAAAAPYGTHTGAADRAARLNRRSDRLGSEGPTICSRGARLARIQEDRRGAPEVHRERPQPTATTPEPTGLDEVDRREYLRAAHPFGWAPAV